MNRTFLFFAMLAVCVCMYQCTNGDEIGTLYGRWKLDSFSSEGTTVHPDTVFIGFQGEAYAYQPNWTYNWGIYTKNDTALHLHKPQYGGTFRAMYINADSASFSIKLLESRKMVLVRHDSVWTFKKILGE